MPLYNSGLVESNEPWWAGMSNTFGNEPLPFDPSPAGPPTPPPPPPDYSGYGAAFGDEPVAASSQGIGITSPVLRPSAMEQFAFGGGGYEAAQEDDTPAYERFALGGAFDADVNASDVTEDFDSYRTYQAPTLGERYQNASRTNPHFNNADLPWDRIGPNGEWITPSGETLEEYQARTGKPRPGLEEYDLAPYLSGLLQHGRPFPSRMYLPHELLEDTLLTHGVDFDEAHKQAADLFGYVGPDYEGGYNPQGVGAHSPYDPNLSTEEIKARLISGLVRAGVTQYEAENMARLVMQNMPKSDLTVTDEPTPNTGATPEQIEGAMSFFSQFKGIMGNVQAEADRREQERNPYASTVLEAQRQRSSSSGGFFDPAGFLGSLPRQAVEAYATDIPGYSDFARNVLKPGAQFLGDVAESQPGIAQGFGLARRGLEAVGGPNLPDTGDLYSAFTPVTAGDVALTAIPAATQVGKGLRAGLPVAESLKRGALTAAETLLPTENLNQSLDNLSQAFRGGEEGVFKGGKFIGGGFGRAGETRAMQIAKNKALSEGAAENLQMGVMGPKINDVMPASEEMRFLGEDMAVNPQALGIADDAAARRRAFEANPKGNVYKIGQMEAQQFASEEMASSSAVDAFESIGERLSRQGGTTLRERGFRDELERIHNAMLAPSADETSYGLGWNFDALQPRPGGTVKRADLFGNVEDTFATERELAGIRESQGGLGINVPSAERAVDDLPMFGGRPPEPPAPPSPPTGGVPPTGGMGEEPPTVSPIAKLTEAIKNAGKATPEQRTMFAQQRAQRTAAAAGALERGQGEEAFQSARGALKGEFERPTFETPAVTPDDTTNLLETIRTADVRFYDKVNAEQALQDLFTGRIPQDAQLKALKRVFPDDGDALINAILDKRGLGTKVMDELIGALGLPQALKASFDISAPFRQGMMLGWNKPSDWAKSWRPMIRAFGSDEAAMQSVRRVESSPWFSIETGERAGLGFKDVGGHIYDVEKFTEGLERAGSFTGFNRSYISRAAQNIPGVGNSQRAFSTFLNEQGIRAYEDVAGKMFDAGIRDPDQFAALAKVINHARGYGDFTVGQMGKGVNAFFSGRNFVARFQTLIDPIVQPGSLFEPSARRQAAKNLAGMIAGDMTVLGMLGAAGAATGMWSVEMDPRSTEWGKLKIGDTRIDPWAGFSPMVRLAARAATGEVKTGTGSTMDADIKGEVLRFLRNKQAPIPSLIVDWLAGENSIGEKFKLDDARIADLFVPFILGDVVEALLDDRTFSSLAKPGYTVGTFASAVGFSTLDYPKTARQKMFDAHPEMKQATDDYFDAFDDAFTIARQDAPEGEPIKDFKNLAEFRKFYEKKFRDDDIPVSKWDSMLGAIEDAYGITQLARSAKERAVELSPDIVDYLEDIARERKLEGEDSSGVPQWMRDLAKDVRSRQPVGAR